jgi:hypothetical protein
LRDQFGSLTEGRRSQGDGQERSSIHVGLDTQPARLDCPVSGKFVPEANVGTRDRKEADGKSDYGGIERETINR